MIVTPLLAFKDNYIWLLDDHMGNVICVDPGDACPVNDYLKKTGFSLRAILLTHHHMDHIGGVGELCMTNPKAVVYGPLDARIPQIHHSLSNNALIDLKPWCFQILSIPGHTSSHICYFETNRQLLFCGDTLFSAGCGRVFDGTYEQLFNSLNLIKELPNETKIYCGHEYTRQNLRFAAAVEPNNLTIQQYQQKISQEPAACTLPSTLALEKQINPFLRLNEPPVKNYAKMHGSESDEPESIFKQLRNNKDKFS